MRYTHETPSETGFYFVRGFKVLPDGTPDPNYGSRHVWEYPMKLYENEGLRFQGPGDLYGELVSELGTLRGFDGQPEQAYRLEWARIPIPKEPVSDQSTD